VLADGHSTPQTADVTSAVELALADSVPFGDCEYIGRRVRLHYAQRVAMLAEYSEYGSMLLAAIEEAPLDRQSRVLRDPAVRIVIDRAVMHFERGAPPVPADTLRDVQQLAAANLQLSSAPPPLAEGDRDRLRLSDGSWPWVWSDERIPDDPAGDFFRRLFDEDMLEGFRLMPPDPHSREMLVAGAELLRILCPRLARSALSHVHLVTLVAGHRHSLVR
jgi:hypothetical protein